MALTGAQRAQVRRVLGYSDQSAGFYSQLEGAMTIVSPDGEAQIVTVLTDIDAVEARLRTSWSRQAVIKAEEVTLAGEGEVMVLRQEASRLVSMLAGILGVPLQRNVFAAGSSSQGMAGRG